MSKSTLVTAVGRIAPGSYHRSRYVGPGVMMVWEHRAISATNVWPDLAAALQQLPDGWAVAGSIEYRNFLWEVDPACGLRPKLPDRREAIKDNSYHAAVASLARALVDALNPADIRAQVKALGLPSVLAKTNADQTVKIKTHPLFGYIPPDIALNLAGYRTCRWNRYDRWFGVDEGDDGFYLERTAGIVYALNPLSVPDAGLAQGLCAAGIWTVYDENAAPVQVHATGVRLAEDPHLGNFGVCDQLAVTRQGAVLAKLPTFVTEGCENLYLDGKIHREPVYLVCGTPETGLEHLRSRPEPVGYALACLYEDCERWSEYIHGERGEREIDDEAVRDDLISLYTSTVMPAVHREEARRIALKNLGAELDELVWPLQRARHSLARLQKDFPEIRKAGELTRVLETCLQAVRVDPATWEPVQED